MNDFYFVLAVVRWYFLLLWVRVNALRYRILHNAAALETLKETASILATTGSGILLFFGFSSQLDNVAQMVVTLFVAAISMYWHYSITKTQERLEQEEARRQKRALARRVNRPVRKSLRKQKRR